MSATPALATLDQAASVLARAGYPNSAASIREAILPLAELLDAAADKVAELDRINPPGAIVLLAPGETFTPPQESPADRALRRAVANLRPTSCPT
jgi:hypothetical protein